MCSAQLEMQRAAFEKMPVGGAAGGTAGGMDRSIADTIKREITDLRFCQCRNARHTGFSSKCWMHGTLGHVQVIVYAVIETDLRKPQRAAERPGTTSHHAVPRHRQAPPALPNPVNPAAWPHPFAGSTRTHSRQKQFTNTFYKRTPAQAPAGSAQSCKYTQNRPARRSASVPRSTRTCHPIHPLSNQPNGTAPPMHMNPLQIFSECRSPKQFSCSLF